MSRNKKKTGQIILLTGFSGSGKTTLGRALQKLLIQKCNKPVEFIDGDEARKFLEIESCFSLKERTMVTKQIAFVAHRLAQNGVNVIVANIAGLHSTRDFLRRKWKRYIQIFLDADIKDCINNDPKNVYKKALKMKSPHVYGIDLPFEKPTNPDLIVYPYKESVQKSLKKIAEYLELYKSIP